MEIHSPELECGSDWIEHEDCIVGNEQGLRNLIAACEEAIDTGESYSNSLGGYVGVKKLDTSFFENQVDSPTTKIGLAALSLVVIAAIALSSIGGFTVYNWIF